LLNNLKEKIEVDFKKPIPVTGRILLSRFCFLSEDIQHTQSYSDSTCYPFFYHLGKYVYPKTMLEIGFGLGLSSGCFFQSCKTVQEFTAYQNINDKFYSHRLGRRNIRCVYKNQFNFCDNLFNLGKKEYNLIFISEESPLEQFRAELDAGWIHLAYGGMMVIDHVKYGEGVCRKVLPDFCKVVNREAIIVDSRYGVSLIVK
jgi:hypothetical protein